MDAMAVAAARGLAAERVRSRDVVLVAGTFGGMQALMPLLGWLAAERFRAVMERWDHWIAFTVLLVLGGKMLVEAWRGGDDDDKGAGADPFALRAVVVLGVATSIDALAAGITLPLLPVPPPLAVVVIGVTTLTLSAAGLYVGRRVGAALGARLEVVGGLALIGVGTKILVEHLLW